MKRRRGRPLGKKKKDCCFFAERLAEKNLGSFYVASCKSKSQFKSSDDVAWQKTLNNLSEY
jgi:hypothetical protein